jgi:hypothetical protein
MKSNAVLIDKIKKKADIDKKNRSDLWFLDTMGFLIAKGFLNTNLDIRLQPNKRLRIEDVIWVGQYVEPRVLEVLPAAVLRLRKHFDFDPMRHSGLDRVIKQIQKRDKTGDSFFDIPFEKLKIWADLPLRDRRIKDLDDKKVVKNFRLRLNVIRQLQRLSQEWACSETEALEKVLLDRRRN